MMVLERTWDKKKYRSLHPPWKKQWLFQDKQNIQMKKKIIQHNSW